MKKRNTLIISTLLIAVLLFAVSCTSLYNDLASSYAPNNIEIISQSSTTTSASQSTASGSSEQTPNDDDPTDDTPPEISWNAPDFTVLDQDGNKIKLSDLAGKPIVVNFWATWCVYCVKEMPDFQTAYEKYPDVQFVMVNATDGHYETVDSAKQFVSENEFTFPIFFDTESSAVTAYNVTGFPATFFIDANGNLVAKASGMISLESLEQGIAMIRGE